MVDSDIFINDSCLLIVMGQLGVMIFEFGVDDLEVFSMVLQLVFLQLVYVIICDGEGVIKFVVVQVEQVCLVEEVWDVVYIIVYFFLIKIVLFVCDLNWGWILVVVG